MMIFNSHLEGDTFFCKSGNVGVLLIHGFTATTAEVRPLARKLFDHGFTVSGPLLPGHGSKPENLNRVKWQDWIGAAREAYLQIAGECDRVFIGGESTGALISLYLAGKIPEIAGILAYAPAVFVNYRLRDRIILRLSAPLLPYRQKSSWSPHPLWQGYGVYPLKGAIQFFRLQKKVQEILPEINQPILICQGRLDETVIPACPDLICAATGSSVKEIHWMEKSGHLVILEDELDQVVELTEQFIKRIIASS